MDSGQNVLAGIPYIALSKKKPTQISGGWQVSIPYSTKRAIGQAQLNKLGILIAHSAMNT